jgi:hypothetical protein
MAAVRHGHHKTTRSVAIGTATFAIAENGHQTVTIHLTRKGRRMLAKGALRSFKARVAGAGVKSGWLVLKLSAHAKHKHHRHKHH